MPSDIPLGIYKACLLRIYEKGNKGNTFYVFGYSVTVSAVSVLSSPETKPASASAV